MSEFRDAIVKIIVGPQRFEGSHELQEDLLTRISPVLDEVEKQLLHIDEHEKCVREMEEEFAKTTDQITTDSDKAVAAARAVITEEKENVAKLEKKLDEEKAEHRKQLQQRMRWIGELQEKLDLIRHKIQYHPFTLDGDDARMRDNLLNYIKELDPE